ncbi:MAG: selenocysteine-specific translation elongation factor [Deltaproteobacteria bacterium]|nr:selenocysteine-specific translation elongation factor [Deltaproteobacteria bacterium]
MQRVIVGTAGHIDHGKTTLVKALTGIDCDRWKEEKARGITIDLGFAHLLIPAEEGDLQVGFVDVPGHERFLHNALAGLGGIRVLLLVVAADEGVKPQTREHLDICSLLDIPAALVALTKSDLAEPDLRELAELEVSDLLADGPFADAEIVPVSSHTGDGIETLRDKLLTLARSHALDDQPSQDSEVPQPVRLPIDRAFHLKGVGVVVTGTLTSGTISTGAALQLLPSDSASKAQTVRVRAIQVHGDSREQARAGERTSLQLSGTALEELERGQQLVSAGAFRETRELCGRLRWLPDAPEAGGGFLPVRLHHFSSEVVGKMRPLNREDLQPGEEAVVEIRLSEPIVAVRGDRFILRRPSPPTTLGGGEILDPIWQRRRGRALRNAVEARLGDEGSLLHAWISENGEGGAAVGDLAQRLGQPMNKVRTLLDGLRGEGRLLAIPGNAKQAARGSADPSSTTQASQSHSPTDRWLAAGVLKRVTLRAGRVLKSYFKANRLALGMPKAEAVQRILPGRGRELAATYLPWLEAQGTLEVDGELVRLPGRKAQLSGEESKLAQAVEAAYAQGGLTPPSPQEVARNLSAKPQILEGVVGYLVERRRLTRLHNGLILASSQVSSLEESLRTTGWERFNVATFKDHFGLSRKWAIPLLEHLDSTGVTRRLGDDRMIVPPAS